MLSVRAGGTFSDELSVAEDYLDRNNNATQSRTVKNTDTENLSGNAKKNVYLAFLVRILWLRRVLKRRALLLNSNYRTQSPNNLSAFCEENFDVFPVDEVTPSLDSLVESCLQETWIKGVLCKIQAEMFVWSA